MVNAGMQPREALREVEARLTAAGCPDADFDAGELFRLVTGQDARLADRPLTAEQAAKLEALTARRATREPLQYLCGSWPFLDFELAVGPGVLCPRADTEVVAEAAAQMLAGVQAPKVLDLCAGTGCLGLGVKRFCPEADVTCVEKSPEAFRYLKKNAVSALKQGTARAVEGDLFHYWQGLPEGELDLIVSNPPYLTAAEMQQLQPEVAREPAMALEAGEDGLVFMLCVVRDKAEQLGLSGRLLLLRQDLLKLDLYGTIRAAVSTFDTFNHIPDLDTAIANAGFFMEKGGVFLFDMNTPYKHRKVLGDNEFTFEEEDAACVWHNHYNAADRKVEITVDIDYHETGEHFHEEFCEYTYDLATIRAALEKHGFALESVCDGETFGPLTEESQRYFFCATKQYTQLEE